MMDELQTLYASSKVVAYRDYAKLQNTSSKSNEMAKVSCSYKQINFPERLHYILNEMEKDGLQHVATWQPHGRCFIVHDPKYFSKEILPL